MNRSTGLMFLAAVAICLLAALVIFHHEDRGPAVEMKVDAAEPLVQSERSPGAESAGRGGWHSAPVRASASAPRPVESMLLSASGLDVEGVIELMSDNRFKDVLDRLGNDARKDLEARELTHIYHESMEAALKQADAAIALNDVECGLSLCGVEFSHPEMDDRYFSAALNSGNVNGVRIYSAVTNVVRLPDGTYSYRMVFATDPELNKIRVPPSALRPQARVSGGP